MNAFTKIYTYTHTYIYKGKMEDDKYFKRVKIFFHRILQQWHFLRPVEGCTLLMSSRVFKGQLPASIYSSDIPSLKVDRFPFFLPPPIPFITSVFFPSYGDQWVTCVLCHTGLVRFGLVSRGHLGGRNIFYCYQVTRIQCNQ